MYRGLVPVWAASSSAVAGASASARYRPRLWPITTFPAAIVAPKSVTNVPMNSCSLSRSIAMVAKLPCGWLAITPRVVRGVGTALQAGCNGLMSVAPDEPAQDHRRPGDIAAGGLRLDLVGLVRVEVARVLVDIDPGA